MNIGMHVGDMGSGNFIELRRSADGRRVAWPVWRVLGVSEETFDEMPVTVIDLHVGQGQLERVPVIETYDGVQARLASLGVRLADAEYAEEVAAWEAEVAKQREELRREAVLVPEAPFPRRRRPF